MPKRHSGPIPDDPEQRLRVFDIPVKRFLERRIVEFGHELLELRPLLDVAQARTRAEVAKEIRVLDMPNFVRPLLQQRAWDYIFATLSQGHKWESTLEQIRSFSSIFLTGAGISFESEIPLSDALSVIRTFCGVNELSELAGDAKKCLTFKSQFKVLCDTKKPGTSHNLIAKNFPNYILEIICLNWDNLVERAANGLDKAILKINTDSEDKVSSARHLWKFHGDVEMITDDNVKGMGGWVFPGEGGHVFGSFRRYVTNQRLRERLFVFVIAGYSETDESICDNVIKIFEGKPTRPVFRIGLDLGRLHEPTYIVGPSDFILRQILPQTSLEVS